MSKMEGSRDVPYSPYQNPEFVKIQKQSIKDIMKQNVDSKTNVGDCVEYINTNKLGRIIKNLGNRIKALLMGKEPLILNKAQAKSRLKAFVDRQDETVESALLKNILSIKKEDFNNIDGISGVHFSPVDEKAYKLAKAILKTDIQNKGAKDAAENFKDIYISGRKRQRDISFSEDTGFDETKSIRAHEDKFYSIKEEALLKADPAKWAEHFDQEALLKADPAKWAKYFDEEALFLDNPVKWAKHFQTSPKEVIKSVVLGDKNVVLSDKREVHGGIRDKLMLNTLVSCLFQHTMERVYDVMADPKYADFSPRQINESHPWANDEIKRTLVQAELIKESDELCSIEEAGVVLRFLEVLLGGGDIAKDEIDFKQIIQENRSTIGKYFDFDQKTWDTEKLQNIGIPQSFEAVLRELSENLPPELNDS